MKNTNFTRLVISGFIRLIFFLALVFLLAGRLDYWQGWAFCSIAIISGIVIVILFKDKQGLIKERLKPGPGMKWWDKVFWVLHITTFMVLLFLAVLDGGRFFWSPELPLYMYIIGYAMHIFSYVFVFWAMWTNEFFSSVVRIQKDRGQHVIQDGPYKYVRHPGYTGAIFIAPSTALVLGSYWALIPAAFYFILLIVRTILEDSTLKKELPGYKEYAKKVRFRLFPGIW